MTKEWFKSWFNTKYYHILYENRDNQEAVRFIDALVQYLQPQHDAHILDLACGKGRHSRYLNQLGFDVCGADLSEESIAYAKQFENDKLHFFTHDMRKELKQNSFTHIFNLFTSFGYFDDENDNVSVLQSVENALTPNGILVIDFMNSTKIINELIPEQTIQKEGIEFHITKKFDGKHICKNIHFFDKGEKHSYTEKVQALTLQNFISLFNATKLQIIATFGDFKLNEFDEKTSDRLILIAKK